MRAWAAEAIRRGAFFCMTVVLACGGAAGQTSKPKTPPLPPLPPTAVAPAPETSLPPYEAQLDRLAEIIGTLAYLRDLCGDNDGAAWRDKMTSLMEAEAGTGPRRERLAGSFNRGFRGYRMTYRVCTDAARIVVDRSLAEGSRIASDLSIHFGANEP